MLATVVDVVGSGYRRPGARMLLTRGGESTGGVSGGCLEGDLIRRAFSLTANGPRCVDYDTRGDEEHPAGRYDTGCEGVVRVLVERVTRESAARPSHPLAALRAAQDADDPAAAATVYRVDGEAGATVGDHAVLSGSLGLVGAVAWTLAAGPLARAVLADLKEVRTAARPRSQVYELPSGRVHALLEPVRPPRDLVVFGAGDDVRPLVALAAALGWRVTVADRRPTWATAARFPDARRVICAPPDESLRRVGLGAETAVVLMTHSLGDDAVLLPAVLASAAGYVGLLGPKARAARLMAELHRVGRLPSPASLARLHAPVGLDLGSAEPAGVALSVLAQIEASFHGRDGGPLAGRTRPIHEPHPQERRDLRDDVREPAASETPAEALR